MSRFLRRLARWLTGHIAERYETNLTDVRLTIARHRNQTRPVQWRRDS